MRNYRKHTNPWGGDRAPMNNEWVTEEVKKEKKIKS